MTGLEICKLLVMLNTDRCHLWSILCTSQVPFFFLTGDANHNITRGEWPNTALDDVPAP
jgi:hypothetical protein